MAVLTTDSLIRSIKRKAMLPENENTFSKADYIEMLNEEMEDNLLPMLMDVKEEHLVTFDEIDFDSDVSAYNIPYRAAWNKLRAIKYVDSSNNICDLSRVDFEDLEDHSNNYNSDTVFYIQSNQIIFPGSFAATNGKIRMYYYLRPSALVSDDEAGVISSIDTVTGVITLSNFPSSFSGATLIDFVQAKTPNKIKAFDISIVSSDNALLTITVDPDDLPTGLAVGDYINLAGETIVPQLPTEMHPLLAQSVAISALESLNDVQGYQVALKRYEDMQKNVLRMLDDRVEGSPQKIKPRQSPIRQTGYGNRRGRYGSWK